MSITIGLWTIPLIITIGLVIWADSKSRNGSWSGGTIEALVAIILSLSAWLVYALLT